MALLASALTTPVYSEFSMNFQANHAARIPNGSNGGNGVISCNFPGEPSADCDRIWHTDTKTDPDTTPFLQELVTDGNKNYYHVVVGDRAMGFATEYYIEVVAGERWPNGYAASASGGSKYNGGIDASPVESTQWGIYFVSPLHQDPRFSGNATARPERVIFRQVIDEGEMFQEIHKATFANKPKIEQVITQPLASGSNEIDASFKTYFMADMSALNYANRSSTLDFGTEVTIEQWVYDDQNPEMMVDHFVLSQDGQRSDATAGKFLYNAGAGSWGLYTYNNGYFNHLNVDWEALRDPTANVPDTPLPGYPGYVPPP